MTERKTKNYDFSFCLPFWDALSEDQRNLLRRNTIVRSYRAGDSVEFTMPEKNGLFMVLEGALRVYNAVASGREITLMIQAPAAICSRSTAPPRGTQSPFCRRAATRYSPISTPPAWSR